MTKNYREKSVDVVCYDELSSFEPDVEKKVRRHCWGINVLKGSVWLNHSGLHTKSQKVMPD
ncbi:hypothetical protein KCP69_13855 [Salmonella enterica subsp. enterica]|nr:hypothetical protein KCP69_13855 [Salmonella enterica subsp. enterica]